MPVSRLTDTCMQTLTSSSPPLENHDNFLPFELQPSVECSASSSGQARFLRVRRLLCTPRGSSAYFVSLTLVLTRPCEGQRRAFSLRFELLRESVAHSLRQGVRAQETVSLTARAAAGDLHGLLLRFSESPPTGCHQSPSSTGRLSHSAKLRECMHSRAPGAASPIQVAARGREVCKEERLLHC